MQEQITYRSEEHTSELQSQPRAMQMTEKLQPESVCHYTDCAGTDNLPEVQVEARYFDKGKKAHR